MIEMTKPYHRLIFSLENNWLFLDGEIYNAADSPKLVVPTDTNQFNASSQWHWLWESNNHSIMLVFPGNFTITNIIQKIPQKIIRSQEIIYPAKELILPFRLFLAIDRKNKNSTISSSRQTFKAYADNIKTYTLNFVREDTNGWIYGTEFYYSSSSSLSNTQQLWRITLTDNGNYKATYLGEDKSLFQKQEIFLTNPCR